MIRAAGTIKTGYPKKGEDLWEWAGRAVEQPFTDWDFEVPLSWLEVKISRAAKLPDIIDFYLTAAKRKNAGVWSPQVI
jgi:hypothetical protein